MQEIDPIIKHVIDTNKRINYAPNQPKRLNKSEYEVVEKRKCRKCEAWMIRRPSKFKEKFWWGCGRWPGCKYTEKD